MLSVEELTQLFHKLGIREPEMWAQAELQERLGNLPRMGFLSQAWAEIPATLAELSHWAEATANDRNNAALAAATERLRAAGAINEDLLAMVRGLMGEFLFRISYLLDDPSFTDEQLQECIRWGFYEETDWGPRRIGGIHELVWSADPLGSG